MIRVVILAQVIDPEKFRIYVDGHLPTISQFGGRIIFRTQNPSTIMGSDEYDAIAIHEWDSIEQFNRWLNSTEYQNWTKIRDESVHLQMLLCNHNISI